MLPASAYCATSKNCFRKPPTSIALPGPIVTSPAVDARLTEPPRATIRPPSSTLVPVKSESGTEAGFRIVERRYRRLREFGSRSASSAIATRQPRPVTTGLTSVTAAVPASIEPLPSPVIWRVGIQRDRIEAAQRLSTTAQHDFIGSQRQLARYLSTIPGIAETAAAVLEERWSCRSTAIAPAP